MSAESVAGADHRSGCMIAVVGPSGAGKDTLLGFASRHFAEREDVLFARRIITRPADAGGEDHECVSAEAFAELERTGGLAVCWDAHGLRYGIAAQTQQAVSGGSTVIANGSRSALNLFQAAYPSFAVITVTARPEILAARLHARGREEVDDIRRRLERRSLSPDIEGNFPHIIVDNSGDVDDGGREIVRAISLIMERAAGM